MRVIAFILLLLFQLHDCFCVAQPDSVDIFDPAVILPYRSDMNNDRNNARSIVSEKWGIDMIPFPHFVHSPKEADSINAQIDSVSSLIESRYGEDWWDTFNNQMAEEQKIQDTVRELIREQAFVVKLDSTLKERDKAMYIILDITNDSRVYTAILMAHELWEGKRTFLTHYELLIDLNDHSVKILDDTIKVSPYN